MWYLWQGGVFVQGQVDFDPLRGGFDYRVFYLNFRVPCQSLLFLRRCQLIARVFIPQGLCQEATLECQREEFSPLRRQFNNKKMRDLRFLPQEIISAETGNEILELVVHALMGDDPEPPVQLFEPPTLQELYDLEVEGSEDSNEEAVNGFFTDSMLLAANEGLELDPPLDTFNTPGVIVESGTGVRKLPDLSSVDCDLHCYEDGFPPSDEEDHEKEQSMQTAAGEGVKAANVGFQLDCPELPGHGCKSCEFHRKNTGVKELLCSLCYMRTHCHFIYSKCV